MTTNSKQERSEHEAQRRIARGMRPVDSDKHKRVAERLLEVGNLYMEAGPQTTAEFIEILEQEYPNE